MKAECKNVEKFVFLMFKKNKLGEVAHFQLISGPLCHWMHQLHGF